MYYFCSCQNSDVSLSFARLNQHQDEDDIGAQIPEIDNPLYNVDAEPERFNLLRPESLEWTTWVECYIVQ